MKQNDYTGLTDAQVLESRKKHGENILTPPEKDSLWKRFFEKLTGPFGHHIKGWEDGDELIFILEIAALLSILISFSEYYGWLGAPSPDGWKVFFEPVGILIAIMLATGIAFHYELKADKEFSLLNQVNDDEQVEVMRNGIITTIPKKEVVVGDIVIVNTGAEIPADGFHCREAVMGIIAYIVAQGVVFCHQSAVNPKKLVHGFVRVESVEASFVALSYLVLKLS
jgi:Ca2+-transporting ATPase